MNKKMIWFIFRFLGTYLFLFTLYTIYLKITEHRQTPFVCDPITTHVAKTSGTLLNHFDQNVYLIQDQNELCIKMIMQNYYILGVIEGCNSISIIILFISFTIAFKGSFVKTLIFTLIGSTSIYLLNIIRISMLAYGFYYHEAYETILHDLLFPAIIYGYVFVLWIIWVQYFSDLKKQDEETR